MDLEDNGEPIGSLARLQRNAQDTVEVDASSIRIRYQGAHHLLHCCEAAWRELHSRAMSFLMSDTAPQRRSLRQNVLYVIIYTTMSCLVWTHNLTYYPHTRISKQ